MRERKDIQASQTRAALRRLRLMDDALYHFEWTLQEAPEAALPAEFRAGEHILYINGAKEEPGTLLGDLVHDFRCTEPADLRNSVLRARMRYLKENAKGVREMTSVMEALRREWRDEGKSEGLAEGKAAGLVEGKAAGLAEGKAAGLAEGRTEIIRTMLMRGKWTAAEIAEETGVPLAEVERIQAQSVH